MFIFLFLQDYDPLHYTLLFPRGNSGWHPEIKQHGTGKRLTAAAYYRSMFQVYEQENNPILRFGKLMAEFACTAWYKVEQQRLTYHRHHQKELRADKYQGLMDSISAKEDLTTVGDRIILAPSHTGSPRWYQGKFQVKLMEITWLI